MPGWQVVWSLLLLLVMVLQILLLLLLLPNQPGRWHLYKLELLQPEHVLLHQVWRVCAALSWSLSNQLVIGLHCQRSLLCWYSNSHSAGLQQTGRVASPVQPHDAGNNEQEVLGGPGWPRTRMTPTVLWFGEDGLHVACCALLCLPPVSDQQEDTSLF